MNNIIDGSAAAKEIREQIKKEVSVLKQKYNKVPGLATILVGENPGSKIYVKLKHKACEEGGIYSVVEKFPGDVSEEEIINKIIELNNNSQIHGILVQLPLQEHINEQKVMNAISPGKDADGFHPENMGNLLIGNEGLVPCTPKGIIYLLEKNNVKIKGAEVVVVNHSNVIGKPITALLLNRNATVTVCHVFTKDIAEHTRKAEILITGTGVPNLIKEDMVKEGVVVIDAGIARVEGKTVGDVDFENVKKKASLITPVPGGVGPMTIAMLLSNTIDAFKKTLE
ncbi:bifunctional methylenetetrahydrofolate dehydrogenase/methenyltetrahydrofolate cyclohydrolase [Candidatus Altiarchaeales archaeon WOR_SM1_SCG]|nr:bifunctional methylenetetrahydrofolate dehydrogenase/methenyltetrahydrofolate cyclohydrolase [Candidatus Altiarchaeales archaeon WOR_SM1_SCG]